jgi:hypothetical protein
VERVARLLRDAVERGSAMMTAMSEDEARTPWREDAWTRKELLGHLVDSASNNHGRFVRAQFTSDLVSPGYDQEKWVAAQRYADAPWASLITLWREFNLHIARVIEATPLEVATAAREKHNLDQIAWRTVPADEPATLEYFMRDYVNHLEHHLHQLLPGYTTVLGG